MTRVTKVAELWLAGAFLAAVAAADDKPRLCISLSPAGTETKHEEKALPGGATIVEDPADAGTLAEVQRAFLNKKFKVASECAEGDVILVVATKILMSRPTAARGGLAAGPGGVVAGGVGAGTDLMSGYLIEVGFPGAKDPQPLRCLRDGPRDDAARSCVKGFQDLVKLRKDLAR